MSESFSSTILISEAIDLFDNLSGLVLNFYWVALSLPKAIQVLVGSGYQGEFTFMGGTCG